MKVQIEFKRFRQLIEIIKAIMMNTLPKECQKNLYFIRLKVILKIIYSSKFRWPIKNMKNNRNYR